MNLVAFNVQFGKRVDRVIDWANRLPSTDVLCFQEFPKDKIRECLRLLSRRQYGFRFAPSLVRRKQLFGVLTLYRKDRMKLVSTSILTLGMTKFERSILRHRTSRSCLITRFCYAGRTVIIVNVHFVAFALNTYKYLQIEKTARGLAKKNIPVIMLGDFNISSVMGKSKLLTIMKTYGFETEQKRLATHRIIGLRHQFDYVFARWCRLSSIRSGIIRLSDHFPIFAQCQLS